MLGRYEHQIVRDQIDGYMISKRPTETPEEYFARAKAELVSNLEKHLESVRQFGFEDFVKKVK